MDIFFSHDRFLVYTDTPNTTALQTFQTAGCRLESIRGDFGGVIYEYSKVTVDGILFCLKFERQ